MGRLKGSVRSVRHAIYLGASEVCSGHFKNGSGSLHVDVKRSRSTTSPSEKRWIVRLEQLKLPLDDKRSGGPEMRGTAEPEMRGAVCTGGSVLSTNWAHAHAHAHTHTHTHTHAQGG